MISKKTQTELNKQINAEMYSAYLYLSMSAYFETLNLSGFANWTYIQYQEEMTHAMKIYHFVIGRGGRVELDAIEAPKKEWKGSLDVMKEVYAHEQKVTGMINDLVDLAIQEKDHATNNFLQWFVAEQVEEEANADEIVSELEFIGDNKQALLMLDRELRGRVFVDETKEA
jgi:ferritin